MREVVEGIPFGHWETGTEGVYWCVQANWDRDSWDYEDMHSIKSGDKLTIWDARKRVVFDGIVSLRRDLCRYSLPNPLWGRPGCESAPKFTESQVVCGMFVHGVQEGVNPETWFKWFMETNHGAYTARLEKKDVA